MRSLFSRAPMLLTLSAVLLGLPLIAYGAALMIAEVVDMVEARSLSATTHFGLALGPVFALLGASFLWPLRPTRD